MPRSPLPELSPCYGHPWDRPITGTTPAPWTMPQPWGAQLDPPPQPPRSAIPCTHRGKRSAGGRSSPDPADGPELQLVPFAVGPGRHTPASLGGTDQHHPQHLLAWRKKGFPSPPPHGTSPPGTPPGCPTGTAQHSTARQHSRVPRTSGQAGLWEIPSFVPLFPGAPQLCTAPHGHWSPCSTAGTWQRERTRSRLLLPLFTGLKK